LVIDVRVKQPLLRSVLPDGTVVLLVVLHDDRCAILRNNETIHEAAGDADGIDGAVHRFMAMTQVSDVLGGGGDAGDAGDAADANGASSGAARAEMARAGEPIPHPAAAARDAAAPPAST
jgi:hypothetical protein